jgi:disulfide bond formation protein DsbB
MTSLDAANPSGWLQTDRGRRVLLVLVLSAVALAILHHTDHILRADHSGWPFKPEVTPFTASLLVYPLFLGIYLARSRPWLQLVLLLPISGAVLVTHVTIEPPGQVYSTWSTGTSVSAENPGVSNLLGVSSAAMGAVAVVVLVVVGALLAVIVRAARSKRRVSG